jgi:hypothetical protein
VSGWKKHAIPFVAFSLLAVACASDLRPYEAPSGHVLRFRVLSAEQVSPEKVKLSVCYELPSEADWVLGRLFGDVTLSDEQGTADLDYSEFLALSDSPPRRCDRLFFSRPGGFPPGDYSLMIKRLAASISPIQDWPALQRALGEVGIVVATLPDDGRSFALISRPPDMTDQEASLVVSGMQEPVVIGPWTVPVSLEK